MTIEWLKLPPLLMNLYKGIKKILPVFKSKLFLKAHFYVLKDGSFSRVALTAVKKIEGDFWVSGIGVNDNKEWLLDASEITLPIQLLGKEPFEFDFDLEGNGKNIKYIVVVDSEDKKHKLNKRKFSFGEVEELPDNLPQFFGVY
ncbi:hypothetical protein ACFL67_03275 [candidate division KSB1 bacterium]